jgi:hypothetical protein
MGLSPTENGQLGCLGFEIRRRNFMVRLNPHFFYIELVLITPFLVLSIALD